MNVIKIRESLKVGWDRFQLRPWYLLGLTLSVMIMFILSTGNAMVSALAYIVFGGYIAAMIQHYNGKTIAFDDLFSLDSRWISFAFLGLIKGLLIFVGLVFFIIPGIYLSIRWMFAELYVIDQGMRPIEALRASSALTKGHMWKLLLFTIVVWVLMLLGLILLLVGAVVASIVVLFAVIKIYNDLKNSPLTAPPAADTIDHHPAVTA